MQISSYYDFIGTFGALEGAMTLSITILRIMTLSIMTLSIMILSIMTLSIMTFSIIVNKM